MIFVGIDNGLSGAITAINKNENILFSTVMPTIKVGSKNEYDINEIVRLFKEHFGRKDKIIIALEKSHVRPVSGKRACFSTGFGYGVMQGVLTSLGLSYHIVSPSEWMNKVITDKAPGDKKPSIMFCKRKYPTFHWGATERANKPSDGKTDATCLAIYAKKYHLGEL